MMLSKIGCRKVLVAILWAFFVFGSIDWLLEHHSITRMQQTALDEFRFACKQWRVREDAFLGPEIDLSRGNRVFFWFKSKNYVVDSVWIGVSLPTSSWLYPYLNQPEVYGPDVMGPGERYRSGE
jgi:hypothetical protein